METLTKEFAFAVKKVTVSGIKRDRAIAAHTEVRELLEADPQLCSWGIDSILIGSYARHTVRYPGKDVDVFLRFNGLDTNVNPRPVYDAVGSVLIAKYGLKGVDPGGRVTKQARSLNVAFTDLDEPDSDLSFSIDAVPAVPWGDHWGIPNRHPEQWEDINHRWVRTSPIRFAEESEKLSTAESSPKVSGDSAYPRVVRLLRQARHVHLGENRPGGLYTEVAAFYAWSQGKVFGTSWAELLAASLREVAAGFHQAAYSGLPDPILSTPMKPELTTDQWLNGAAIFNRLADEARVALSADRCKAAKMWREILGTNDRGPVLPLPAGCDANGFPITSVAAVTAVGSDEPRGFA